jgi:hypothetical protein
MVARAFVRLPVRWRAVLWQLEVEGNALAAVAPLGVPQIAAVVYR